MKKKNLNLILICLFSNIILAQGGDNAATAAANPISIPFSVTGSTVGATGDYQIPITPGNYTWTSDAGDWVYYVCPTTTDILNINIDYPISINGIYPSISVWDGLPGTGTLVASTWFAGAGSPTILGTSFTPVIGKCYYILIDNFLHAVTPIDGFDYTLNINASPPPLSTQPACTNIGFEDGNLNGWRLSYGCHVESGTSGASMPHFTPTIFDNSSNQAMITTSGNDPLAGFPMVSPSPGMGSYSVRLGDGDQGGAVGVCLEQKFSVTSSNALFLYNYAVVINGGISHPANEQPFFKVDIYDCNGNIIPCGQYLVVGGLNSGFTQIGTSSKYFKNWTPVFVDLTPYIGSCITVKYSVADCSLGAHFCYAYIDATCAPMSITGNDHLCSGQSTTLTAPAGSVSYTWTELGNSTVLGTNQSFSATPTVNTTYQCVITSVSGCITTLTYPVKVIPPPIVTVNSPSICVGNPATVTATASPSGGTFTWTNGGGSSSSFTLSPNTTTSYTVTYTNTDGCTDTAIATIHVNPLPIVSVNNVTICAGSSATITASTTPSGTYSYAWTVPIGCPSPGNVSSFSTSLAGVYSVVVTNTVTSCSSYSVTCTIANNPLPTVVVNSPTICSGQSINVNATTGSPGTYSYAWTVPNGFAAPGNVSNFNTSIAGTYSVIVTNTVTGCVSNSASGIATLIQSPSATVNSSTVCAGTPVAVAATTSVTGNYSYTWLVPTGAVIPGNVSSFTTSTSGVYSVIVTDQTSLCSSIIATGTITILALPTATISGTTTICSGNSSIINFNGTPNAVVSYKVNSGNTQTLVLDAQGNGSISSGILTATTIYDLIDVAISTAPFCNQVLSSTATITVENTPVVTFNSDVTSGCAPLKVQFVNTNANISNWNWNFGDGFSANGSAIVSHTYNSEGCFDVTLNVTSVNGCGANLNIPSMICVKATPIASFNTTPNVLSSINPISTMDNSSTGAVSYQWNFGDGTASIETNPTHNFVLQDGIEQYTITLIATSEEGCQDTAIVTIGVFEELIYYIPNAFTPDGDKFNQLFQPIFTKGYDPDSFTMAIFNRWGEIIFETSDTKVGWDGTYCGQIVQDGIYTWLINFKVKSNDERKSITGHVNLIR